MTDKKREYEVVIKIGVDVRADNINQVKQEIQERYEGAIIDNAKVWTGKKWVSINPETGAYEGGRG